MTKMEKEMTIIGMGMTKIKRNDNKRNGNGKKRSGDYIKRIRWQLTTNGQMRIPRSADRARRTSLLFCQAETRRVSPFHLLYKEGVRGWYIISPIRKPNRTAHPIMKNKAI